MKRDYKRCWTNVIITLNCTITLIDWSAKDCKKYKLAGRGYGLLPEREVWNAPWEEIAIDLIGPWKVKVNGQQVEFNSLTCIDIALILVGLICIDNKTAEHIRDKFTQSWLCQYPCPVQCLHDKEGGFMRQNFWWHWKSLASRMYAQQAKIHNLMLSVKGCIRQ